MENETATRPPAGLYVVGTPIGHLDDVTFRAIATLRVADLVLAEDTRITQRLFARYDLRAPLLSCHRFREASRVAEALARIRGGAVVALVTDSGMPGVSDPGARMVAACREAGLPVTAIPGPSAVTAAVALSGFEGVGFYFAGFLPHKSGARARRLSELSAISDPVVLFESPFRFLRLLEEIELRLPGRRVFAARELTKRFEELRLGLPAELRAAYAGRAIRGEFTIVIEPPARRSGGPGTAPDGAEPSTATAR